MSTESISDRAEHVRSVSVTAVAALLGVGAALASSAVTGDVAPAEAAGNQQAQAIVLAAIAVQLVAIKLGGIYDEDELGPKLYLFIVFMTFSMWFVSWGILLTAEYTS